jgi:hypothetical protein
MPPMGSFKYPERTVRRVCSSLLWLGITILSGLVQPSVSSASQTTDDGKKVDAFFAGTVVTTTQDQITISRTVLGTTEQRSFRVTPDTRVEGRLRARVRVTVRYSSDDDGDTATLIVVRAAQKKK